MNLGGLAPVISPWCPVMNWCPIRVYACNTHSVPRKESGFIATLSRIVPTKDELMNLKSL